MPARRGRDALLALLGSSNIASRRWAFEQYDCIVGSRTTRRPEQADAAVLKLAHEGVETGRAIAVSVDGNGRRVACDPYVGAAEAVVECAANLACAGAAPLGLTNCLNFGNPEKPHVAWQLERAVSGMAAACRALDVPVVGGNVSLYNEGGSGPIYPTPIVGMVGELAHDDRAGRSGFRAASPGSEPDMVALIGPFTPSLAGSELAKLRGELAAACRFLRPRRRTRGDRAGARRGRKRQAVERPRHLRGRARLRVAESALWGGVGAMLDLEPLMRRAERRTPTRRCSARARPASSFPAPERHCWSFPPAAPRARSWRSAASAANPLCISAGAATIEVSIEDARSVFESSLAETLS